MEKKRKFDELSDEGPLSQSDVKYFRKQAIWRQMNFYKNRYQVLENLIEGYKQKLAKQEEDGQQSQDDELKVINEGLVKEIEELNKVLRAKDREDSESLKRIHNNNVVKHETTSETPDNDEINKLKTVLKEYETMMESMKSTTEVAKVDVVKLELIKEFKVSDNNQQELIKTYQDKLQALQDKINGVHNKEVEELRELLDKNEKDLVRIRNIRDDLLNKITALEMNKPNEQLIKLNEELANKLKFVATDQTNEDIIKELEESYKSLITDMNIKIKTQIDQDNMIKKYQIEKSKADQKYFQIMKLKDNLTNENKLLKLNLNKLTEINTHQKSVEVEMNSKINKLQDINQEFQKTINNLNINNNQLIEKSRNNTKEMTKLIAKIEDLTKALNNEKTLQQDYQKKVNMKELEMIKMKNGLISLTGGEELNGFRSMVKCSLCSKNWKNTVLTVCGHVFCSECVKQRLDARLRRCPSCNKGFSQNDTLSIHL